MLGQDLKCVALLASPIKFKGALVLIVLDLKIHHQTKMIGFMTLYKLINILELPSDN